MKLFLELLNKKGLESLDARKRLKWTLGLSAIFVFIPIYFLFPRIVEQVKTENFTKYHWRGDRILERASMRLYERLGHLQPHSQLRTRDVTTLKVAGLLAYFNKPEKVNNLSSRTISLKYFEPKIAFENPTLENPNLKASYLPKQDLLVLHWLSQNRLGRNTVRGLVFDANKFLEYMVSSEYRRSLMGVVAAMRITYPNKHHSISKPIKMPTNEGYIFYPRENEEWLLVRGGYLKPPSRIWDKPRHWMDNQMLLYEGHLPEPLEDFEVKFTTNVVPFGPTELMVFIDTCILIFALLIGGAAIYVLWTNQINLAERQKNFIASVTHELKSPLTSIRMFSEMLVGEWKLPPEKNQQYLCYIHKESERLSRLIDSILLLSQINRKQHVLQFEKISLRNLIDATIAQVNPQLESANFQLEVSLPTSYKLSELYVRVDQDAFLQMIVNIVDNAIKFSTSKDCHTVELEILIQDKAQLVSLGIRDFGPGIQEETQQHIFDLFYRAETELIRTTKGTGIGLAIVKKLSELMNVSIGVENANPGSKFTIAFPLVRSS